MVYPSHDVRQVVDICKKNHNNRNKYRHLGHQNILIWFPCPKNYLICIRKNELVSFHGHKYELFKKIFLCYCCIRLKHHMHGLKTKSWQKKLSQTVKIYLKHEPVKYLLLSLCLFWIYIVCHIITFIHKLKILWDENSIFLNF